MKLSSLKKIPARTGSEVFVLFITEETVSGKYASLDTEAASLFRDADLDLFKGKSGELFLYPPKSAAKVILCGLGEEKKVTPESLKSAAASAVPLCRDKGFTTIHIFPPDIASPVAAESLAALAQGIALANYSFDRYRNIPPKEAKPLIEKAVFITALKEAPTFLNEMEIICRNILLCRDLVNETSEESNPLKIVALAKKIAGDRITCEVFGKNEISRMKMGLLLAVNKGSKIPPQMVVLTYKGNPSSKKYLAMVGKGITFDSGGVNLKPSGHIETMRMDMAGAAAVMFALKTAAELKLKKNLYAVMPLTENMISNEAYRPGDIFTAYNGKTVEIGNTDAEGRLILADALAYTSKKLKPEYVVDLATLTGACIVALGETVAAFLSTNDDLKNMLKTASEQSGEKIWELPLYPEYDENMKSEIADISNMSAERNAGTIMGAVFLKNFVDDAKWAHIDIAGTAWYSKQRGYRPKNATGYGVHLLTELIKDLDI
ncbi:MAG TPA: leucyl aminopeptidase [Spirochaetota bacterium]|nr:leucyl aminopeptidase [Spirochaetota bacterium]HPI90620.1 leucyl aminopeptidase [Spirochaetota bacterium]HPR46862.1 leucyl aminopeptidase [Spirochaetota bacterium]